VALQVTVSRSIFERGIKRGTCLRTLLQNGRLTHLPGFGPLYLFIQSGWQQRNTTWKLVAISAQRFVDHRLVALSQYASTTQVPLTLLAHANGQVARAGTAVLHFAIGCDPKTLFGCLVRLHLGHKSSLFQKMFFSFSSPDSCRPGRALAGEPRNVTTKA